jgi:diguanylate cyclase (GGDEF)-like protein/PAS domain S-box-containing protein
MSRPIGVRTLLFVVLAIASVAPALFLASRIGEPAMARELEAVRERHLLVARNLASILERYTSDAELVFRATTKAILAGIDHPYLSDLLVGLDFYHVCIVEPSGAVVASALPPDGKAPARIPERVLAQIGPLPPAGVVKFSSVQAGPDGVPRIFLAMRLPERDLAIAAISTDYIREIQETVSFGIGGHAAIVDQTGRVLAHPREDWRVEMKDLGGIEPVDRMLAGGSGVSMFYSPALKAEMVAGYATVKGAGWGAMIPQPLTELEASARRLQTLVLSIILFGALCAAGLSWWLAGYLTRPVVAVTRAARKLANGESLPPVALGRGAPTELRSLVESFDTMVARLAETNGRLRLSEARFRSFAETAADWFWETDPELLIVYLSDQFQSTTGSPPDAVLGKRLQDELGARIAAPAARQHFLELVAGREPFFEVELHWADAQDGQRFQHVNGGPVFDEAGVFQGYRGTGRDVTTARQLSERLSHQAKHDDLTGLINRREFEQQLQELLKHLAALEAEHALCYLDLDRFKLVNDTCGHVAGDELLRQVAALLLAQIRRGDHAGRLGGDEFGIVLVNCSRAEAVRVASTVKEKISELRFVWQGNTFAVGASIGVTVMNAETADVTAALQEADAACYAAKHRGRNRIHVYRHNDMERARRQGEMQWISKITTALDEDRMHLHCQRIVALGGTRAYAGCEILLRLETEDGIVVPAETFMPAAERYDLVTRLDHLVVERAFAWLADAGGDSQDVGLCCINLSGRSLNDEAFLDFLFQKANDCGSDRHRICFEITETVAIANLSSVTSFVRELKDKGFQFALDDFGSGLSSFAYLKSLPVDFIKIDGAFVRNLVDDPVDFAMVRAINDMGHALGKRTIAEFVENERTAEMLQDMGVDFVQGSLYGMARPVRDRERGIAVS